MNTFKLKTLIETIKEVKAMTDEEWIEAWVQSCTPDSIYIPRNVWLAQLEEWALKEAESVCKAA